MSETAFPALSFDCEFDEPTARDVEEKGFFDHAIVTLEDGSQYRLHFYDPERLVADLKTDVAHGRACIGEPGLVVVPRVTPGCMREAVSELSREGYFASLKPLEVSR